MEREKSDVFKGVASMRQDEAIASSCFRRRQIFAHLFHDKAMALLQPPVRHRWQLKWRLESWLDACGTTNYAAKAFLDPQNAPKSLAAGASPQTPLGELAALPRPPSWIQGVLLRRLLLLRDGRGGDGKGWQGKGGFASSWNYLWLSPCFKALLIHEEIICNPTWYQCMQILKAVASYLPKPEAVCCRSTL